MGVDLSIFGERLGEIKTTFDTLQLDTLDYWMGWPEIYQRDGLVKFEQDSRGVTLSFLDADYAKAAGYQKQLYPFSSAGFLETEFTPDYGFLPKKFFPTYPVQFEDYGVYTKTILEMSMNRRLKKRKSTSKRYHAFTHIPYGEHNPSLLWQMFLDWKENKVGVRKYEGLIEDLVYRFYFDNKHLACIPDHPKGFITEHEGRYVGWSIGVGLTRRRWTSLIRIVVNPNQYPGLSDFLYGKVAGLFADTPEESDGLAGFGGSVGCAFFKSSYSSPELMRYYVKTCK